MWFPGSGLVQSRPTGWGYRKTKGHTRPQEVRGADFTRVKWGSQLRLQGLEGPMRISGALAFSQACWASEFSSFLGICEWHGAGR